MGLHHVELWIDDLDLVRDEWAWLLGRVGLSRLSAWPGGETWGDGGAYLTLTGSPNLADGGHDRRRPGVNHLAFWAGGRGDVDAVMHDAPAHGWRPLYHERYPHAGGPDHYAGWLQNAAGFKVEVVAEPVAD
ncbi:VOC family protein [Microbacterium kyungheense]|uniref:Glyoxalase/bleomycin resistance protein/dioxygenase superfamily protein n=1 Tax=Microbacterium kyungheense TaxID=1263636 RepID=A0A543EU14_9MICO|nr:VOC family protein [Microbacterium kyungheense]TQM25068.1 glyoxalase/bleomycin resistance protein/dioxygenase superfamily protein [Microbacterium kyungheense]